MVCLVVLIFVLGTLTSQINAADYHFDTYYAPLWGGDHLTINSERTKAQIMLDQSSGAGFASKSDYESGFFHIKLKIPDKKTGGVNTNFYLTSLRSGDTPGNHFELDFEFLGTNGTMQTNVYDNDAGGREQSFNLWFDPSKDFHSYDILWNSHQIAFLIDQIPIRVFKNNKGHGIQYPDKPLHIEASVWNANWAGEVDWSQAPFIAYYTDFGFDGCTSDVLDCASETYYWNQEKFWDLSPNQKQQMNQYRSKYMSYDYCTRDSTRKPECSLN